MVEIEEGPDKPKTDENGKILTIEHDDGSITVSLDGRSIDGDSDAARAEEWFGNLVEDIDQGTLGRIGEDLLRGVRDDMDSRQD